MQRSEIICPQYKALFKETFRTVLAATYNEQFAERVAMEHVLSAAILSVAEARREIIVIDNIRTELVPPLSIELH